VRHFEIDATIAHAGYAAPVRRFRPLAEAECRGLPVSYAHLALSIAMDAELRALAVQANECPLALIACGRPPGLNLMWDQYAIAMVRTSCTGTAKASGQLVRWLGSGCRWKTWLLDIQRPVFFEWFTSPVLSFAVLRPVRPRLLRPSLV
jgi:hypothetical protein